MPAVFIGLDNSWGMGIAEIDIVPLEEQFPGSISHLKAGEGPLELGFFISFGKAVMNRIAVLHSNSV